MYELIPQELKERSHWVCWQAEPDSSRPGKIKKIPINPRTGGKAQSNNPETWTDFQTALTASKRFTGLGFMFAGGYFGVDIDNAGEDIADYRAGGQDNIVAEFVHSLCSYAEYSQSGRGIHIICRGELPPSGRRRGSVEMYSEGRFFVMTGDRCAEYAEIKDCTTQIRSLHEKYIGAGTAPSDPSTIPEPLNLTDTELLELARKSKQGQIFSDLYAGRWEAYFTSQSEADMSFCNMLAFWCRRDEQRMDRIFRSSGLMRPKWERRQSGSTYGQLTIIKAISSCRNIFEPQQEYSLHIASTQPSDNPPKAYSLDDTGNAERLKDLYGDRIRYSYVDKAWYYYDGRRWKLDDTGEPKRLVDGMLDFMRSPKQIGLYAEDEDALKAYEKHIKTSRSSKAKTAALKETEHLVSVTPAELDTHSMLFNTPGGILDLQVGEIQPHDSTLYISKIGYAEYTDKTDCPIWERFLCDIFSGDRELIRFIQKAVGYSLTGSTAEQCAFFCYGTGRNGKSTFLDVVTHIMGDYAVNIQPETIMVKKQAGGANSDIARLKGARFVTSVEPNDGMRLDEGLLKQLTGGDRVTARRLYGNEFEFLPEFKLWMGTNHKPIIRGTDIGIWRRIMLLPFTVKIPDSKVDKHLKYKLRRELPGILAWAVEGCLLWQREGLKPPAAVSAATKEYKSEMDVISGFLEACCTEGGEVPAVELYRAYKQWAHENGEYEGMSNTKFGREIAGKFTKVRRSSGFYYIGLNLTDNYKPYSVSIA